MINGVYNIPQRQTNTADFQKMVQIDRKRPDIRFILITFHELDSGETVQRRVPTAVSGTQSDSRDRFDTTRSYGAKLP
jgi:hypothetical protein